jgi:hypothetical protein
VAQQVRPSVSEDGRWYWDGAQWKSLLSPDGRSVWNGAAWVAITAPAPEPVAIAAAPAPVAPAPAAPAQPESPSWLAAQDWGVVERRLTPDPTPAPAAEPEAAQDYVAYKQGPAAPAFQFRSLFPLERMAPIALVLIGAIVAGGFWWTHRPEDAPPVILVASHASLVYQSGDTLRFTATQEQHGQLTLPNGQVIDDYAKITAVEAWRVIQVDPDGTTTVGLKFESLTGAIDGEAVSFNAAKAKEAVLVVKPDGRVVSGGTNGSAGGKATNSVPASDQFFSVLPDHDVRAGESWGKEWTRPNPLGTGNTTYRTTNTFTGYDTLSQYGRSAVVKTTATLPIDAGLNIRALLALTGDDPTGVPEGATVTYKGNADADLTTYVDMNSRLPVHMLDVANFTFDMTFQGLPDTAEWAPLKGTFKWAGHQSGSMDLIDLPKHATPA